MRGPRGEGGVRVSVESVDRTLLDTVCSRVRDQLSDDDAARAEAFVRQYYRWVAPEDLAERDPLDVYGLALAHFNLARRRRPGTTKVRVYNPQFEEHGWQSSHTAVEVVTDDMPFLTDSVTMELNRRGFGVHVVIHPVMSMRRDEAGHLVEVLAAAQPPDGDGHVAESVIHAEVDRHTDPADLEQLRGHLLRVIGEVRAAVEDWPKMRERALAIAADLDENPPPLDAEEIAEAKAFLEWLEDHNFTFLGYREYALERADGELRLNALPDSGLGILRQTGERPSSHGFARLPPGVRALALELFQITVDELFEIAMGILHLGERQRVRMFIRRDPFGRFLTCLVYVPRDRFNTENRQRIEAILRDEFDATSIDYTTRVSESVLVRLHYLVYTDPSRLRDFDSGEIEARIVAATRSWADDLREALIAEHGEERGGALFRRYGEAFPTAYRADWVARSALADVRQLERLDETDDLSIKLYLPLEAPPGSLRAKVFKRGTALTLSDMLPLFENMGVVVADERPYRLRPSDTDRAWIYDFGLTYPGRHELDMDDIRESFEDAFLRVWRGGGGKDGYKPLVLGARPTPREITVLRAIGRYLRQAGTRFSDHYVEQSMVEHPEIARLLIALFRARFDPRRGDREDAEDVAARIAEAIDAVESLEQDQILRTFLDVVRAMLRTNYFQSDADGGPKSHVSFKLDPSQLPWLPLPRPQFEIFVYPPRTEGVHLRGGQVGLGGIRWSDRPEDFRTEVLGLMKAQMVK